MIGLRALLLGGAGWAAMTAAAPANDSYAVLDGGGLVLASTDQIALEEEDLFLSRDEVRVAYRFRNLTDRDLSAEVAFPLPAIDVGQAWATPLLPPFRQGDDFVGFTVSAEGRALAPQLDWRAVLPGPPESDITERLAALGVPLMVFRPGYWQALNRLPGSALDGLRALAAAEISTADTGKGPETEVIPQWQVRGTYHWRQTFPAGRSLRLEHRYRPFAGYFWLPAEPDAEQTARFCIDRGTSAGIRRKVVAANGEAGPVIRAAELGYILTTAKSWSGPIRRFRLTIDKGSKDAIVSLCFDGLKKLTATRFVAEFENYRPEKEIRLLFAPAREPAGG